MKNRKNIENTWVSKVEQKGWCRKQLVFQSISSDDILNFPKIPIKDLKILFTGTYQLF